MIYIYVKVQYVYCVVPKGLIQTTIPSLTNILPK